MKKTVIKKIIKYLIIALPLLAVGVWLYVKPPAFVKKMVEDKTYLPKSLRPSDIGKIKKEDLVKVEKGAVESKINTSGNIVSKEDIKVVLKMPGTVTEMAVKENQTVKKGQKIAVIKPGANEFDEYKPLPLFAPIDGAVMKCSDSRDDVYTIPLVGDSLRQDDCLLRVVNMKKFMVPVYLTEDQVVKIKTGVSAAITIPVLDLKMDGKVSSISNQLQSIPGSYRDKAYLVLIDVLGNNDKIKLGLNSTVDIIETKKEDVLLVPIEAIYTKQKESFVFKYKGGNEKEKITVKTGISDAKNVEITEGLAEGDEVLKELPIGESW